MNININDYLTESEMKEIVIDEFRKGIRKEFETEQDARRILTNISYHEVWDKIDKEIPDYRNIITKQVKDRLKEISSFDILRRKDDYGYAKNSIAQDILEKCVLDNKNIIENKVKTILNAISETDLKYEIQSIIEDYFEKLFEKNEAII